MRRRRIGYAVWLLLSICLYFFENNTGTRVVLACSALVPLLPLLRSAFFPPDGTETEKAAETQTVKSFIRQETDEPGDVRVYLPGDPVCRIHWKLSAKKDDLLIRDTVATQEPAEEIGKIIPDTQTSQKSLRKRLSLVLAAAALFSLFLLLLIPEARHGAQALCNRLFAASEEVNSYAYQYFPVAEHQSVTLAGILLILVLAFLIALTVVVRSHPLTLCVMAATTITQVYFGLSFPARVNIPLYGLLALLMMKQHPSREILMKYATLVLVVFLSVILLYPGVDIPTETASEMARDRLSQMAQLIGGAVSEAPAGEMETRHVHTQSLETGNRLSLTGREFRLMTVEEEQISMPHWVNHLKIILLLLLATALLIVPFAPFLLLNARRKKAQETREIFESENIDEAVCAIFHQVISWLDATDHGAGNLLYRDWANALPDVLPEGYADRFSQCAETFEEAVYSHHTLPCEKRQQALSLLKETETALWTKADWKQRIRLKYWLCLCE
ncbi:MAG: DUF58 domain-containing protein [Christensenellales bacterium]|jgi:hypothetical protein